MKKKIIIFLLMMLCVLPATVSAEQISSWAKNEYTKMSSRALLDDDLLSGSLKDNITRKDFCTVITNVYGIYDKITLSSDDYNKFTDTDDEKILMATKAGIVNGKGDGIFDPSGNITRQEMSVMITRLLNKLPVDFMTNESQVKSYKQRFIDNDLTADWAMQGMASMCAYDIISGVGDFKVDPLGYATKEQAVCMLARVVTYFVEYTDIYEIPKVINVTKSPRNQLQFNIRWSVVGDVKNYKIIVKSQNAKDTVFETKGDETHITVTLPKVPDDKYTVYISANLYDKKEILSLPYELDNALAEVEKEPQGQNPTEEPEIKEPEKEEEEPKQPQEDTPKEEIPPKEEKPSSGIGVSGNFSNVGKFAITEKEQRVFPEGHYFTTKEEAQSNMQEVTVPVWRLKSDGEKVSSEKTLTVNSALAEDVINIFTEIYNDESQFPIKDVGGFSWRNTAGGSVSQHSYGTCIDINYMENYYVKPDGTPITGTHWSPGEDPYSIAEDSIVVKTFAKYGWLWGGNAWGEGYNKDYMHFTYLGK